MSNQTMEQVEELRKAGLEAVRTEKYAEALEIFDRALTLCSDEEKRELLTINKADAMIGLDQSGLEVQQLPMILMRRRNPHHVFLAAYALMYKHRIKGETKRGIFYGEIALKTANEANESFWKVAALNDLGIVYEGDSQFSRAIECFNEALSLIGAMDDASRQQFSTVAITQNLGYNMLHVGEIDEALTLIHSVIDQVTVTSTLSDSYRDLCYGYVELGQFERARHFGQIALDVACNPRHTKNAHYLLGEIAYKLGDTDTAESHFDALCTFYPEFGNLKSLLFAIDLRTMVNWQL